MGCIFCLMGKSSSGKDTIYARLLQDRSLGLERLVTGTTRPIREGERDGVEYYFYSEEALSRLERENRIIECRAYETVHGIWKYFTVADEHLDLEHNNYLTINTLEAYCKLREYYGLKRLVPIYIDVEDGIRLKRALEREMAQASPKYAEMCRRYLADEEDFSKANLEREQIQPIFENVNLDETVEQITSYIRERTCSK